MLKGRNKVEVLCSVCGRSNKNLIFYYDTQYGKDLCIKHYKQIKRHGKIFERTRFDKNEYILYEGYAEIVCYNNYQIETERLIIDLEDIEKCKEYKWSLSNGYAVGHIKKVNNKLRLNRFLLEYEGRFVVDHKDQNPLNNRKENLRICEQVDNSRNCKLSKNNTSGITGVTWDEINNKWASQIQVDYKIYKLGRFLNKEEAIISRLRAELKYFGEDFSPQRNLFGKYNIKEEINE